MPYSHLKILRDMDDAPLPQYLGADGELRVLDKEALQEIILLNFPDLQKVSDEDVLAMLDQILTKQGTGTQTVKDVDVKAELTLIKNQQAQILTRLNGEFNAKVTNPSDPVEFPDIQPVKDTDVNTRLLSIEQSNAAILTKLNGVVDTQVTGSNVEDGIAVKDQELIEAVQRGGLVAVDQNLITGVGAIRIWTGTLNEYDTIATKDENIIYMVRS